MNSQTEQLEQKNQKLKMAENIQRIVTDGVILIAGVLMAAVCGHFAEQGTVSADQAMVAVIAMISSFGPTAALSVLSNNLQHTLASGNRVLDILEEEPLVEDVLGGSTVCEGDISCEHVSFAYESALTKEGQKGAQAEFTKEDKVEIQADYYTERRSNILMSRADIPATMGLQQTPQANIGKAEGHGFDMSIDLNHSFTKDFH